MIKLTKQLEVKDLKEFIEDLPDNMKVYITSKDDMPVRILTGVEWEERTGYYSELYLETEECGSNQEKLY
ncbi:hypothetical protein [Clostridium botulinum]|uniref:hypothetical protein n=1 Tax=Clostridium botulinum TaxID=1491 RepID=UPI00095797DF|nr:hypothetical protein [Clostridium botulinum]APU60214.1 hypothetical protein NPD8_2173 [Clostridium botulinum]